MSASSNAGRARKRKLIAGDLAVLKKLQGLELIKFEKQHVKDSCRHADLVARIRRSMHNLEHDAASTIARHVSNW